MNNEEILAKTFTDEFFTEAETEVFYIALNLARKDETKTNALTSPFNRSQCEKDLLLIFRDDVLPHRVKELVDYIEGLINKK